MKSGKILFEFYHLKIGSFSIYEKLPLYLNLQLYKIPVLCVKTRAASGGTAPDRDQLGTSWGRAGADGTGTQREASKLGQAPNRGRAAVELRLDRCQTCAPRSRAQRSEPQPTPWREGARGRRKEAWTRSRCRR